MVSYTVFLQNQRTGENVDFAAAIRSIGLGTSNDDDGYVFLSSTIFNITTSTDDAFAFCHPDPSDAVACADSMFIVPTNDDVDNVNAHYFSTIRRQEHLLRAKTYSIDGSEEDWSDEALFGRPGRSASAPEVLSLKRGCIIMLLRNMDISRGLTNGTMLEVITISNRMLHCMTFAEYVLPYYYVQQIVVEQIRLCRRT